MPAGSFIPRCLGSPLLVELAAAISVALATATRFIGRPCSISDPRHDHAAFASLSARNGVSRVCLFVLGSRDFGRLVQMTYKFNDLQYMEFLWIYLRIS